MKTSFRIHSTTPPTTTPKLLCVAVVAGPLALVSCASLLASLWALVCGVAFPRLGGFRNLPRPAGRVHSARSSRSFISLLRGVLCHHRSLGVTLSSSGRVGFSAPTVRLPLSGSCDGSDRRARGHAPASLSLRSAQRSPSGGFFRLARRVVRLCLMGFPSSAACRGLPHQA